MVGPVALFMVGAGMASPFAITGAVSVNPLAIGAASGLYGFVQMTLWRVVHGGGGDVAAGRGVSGGDGAAGLGVAGAGGVGDGGAAGVMGDAESAARDKTPVTWYRVP